MNICVVSSSAITVVRLVLYAHTVRRALRPDTRPSEEIAGYLDTPQPPQRLFPSSTPNRHQPHDRVPSRTTIRSREAWSNGNLRTRTLRPNDPVAGGVVLPCSTPRCLLTRAAPGGRGR